MAGLNHLARCLVVPRRVLVEQDAELIQLASYLLFGVDPPLAGEEGTNLFLSPDGFTQVGALVVVQKEDRADISSAKRTESEWAGAPDATAFVAGVECVVDSLVRLGLLCGLDRTSLQVVQSDWDVFTGHKGLTRECLGVCVRGFVGLKGLAELHGGSGLDELHGLDGLGELKISSILPIKINFIYGWTDKKSCVDLIKFKVYKKYNYYKLLNS